MNCPKSKPRTNIWGRTVLTGYSCKSVPSRTIWSFLLPRNDKIWLKTWPKISLDLSLWRRPAYQTLSTTFNISSAMAPVVLAVLSDTTIRRSAVELEDVKPYRKLKKSHFSRGTSCIMMYYLQVLSKTWQTTERRLIKK